MALFSTQHKKDDDHQVARSDIWWSLSHVSSINIAAPVKHQFQSKQNLCLQYIAIMASSKAFLFIILFILAFSSFSTQSRKMSGMHEETMSKVQGSVYAHTLEKPVAVSMVSKRGIAFARGQKLVASQNEMVSRRRAQSTPSPGIGH